jgi:hypothetical protein
LEKKILGTSLIIKLSYKIIRKNKMIKEPINKNYCATVVEIKNIIPLENCDNVVHTNIFGNLVIVGKDTNLGDVGLFFPVETKLSPEFLRYNNLYRDNTLNIDQSKKGYFEVNGRIRCMKFRQNKSMGFFIPLDSIKNLFSDIDKLDQDWIKVGSEFDELNGKKICEKYVSIQKNQSSQGQGKQRNKNLIKRFNVLLENQFRFHQDTALLGKNIFKIKEDDIISITTKLHGTSVVISKVLCKRKLNIIEKFLKFVGIKIQETEYKNIWSSRKVIKNQFIYPKNEKIKHYYNIDIWTLANNKIKDILQNGMTIYAEIVGYLPSNSYIQKGYDYGCEVGTFEIYVYRMTYTNVDGIVIELSMSFIKFFCKLNGLKVVPELYYGYVKDLYNYLGLKNNLNEAGMNYTSGMFLELLNREYLEKKSIYCNNDVPEEGIVVRIEKNDYEAYKLKSFIFQERETKNLDSGEEDIEESQK